MPFNEERKRNFERAQRAAAHVMSHPRLREAFEEIEDSDATLEQARSGAKRFLEKKGIQLPAEAEVSLESGSCCYRICFWGFCFYACTEWWNC
jgi:hypothetical protein